MHDFHQCLRDQNHLQCFCLDRAWTSIWYIQNFRDKNWIIYPCFHIQCCERRRHAQVEPSRPHIEWHGGKWNQFQQWADNPVCFQLRLHVELGGSTVDGWRRATGQRGRHVPKTGRWAGCHWKNKMVTFSWARELSTWFFPSKTSVKYWLGINTVLKAFILDIQ